MDTQLRTVSLTLLLTFTCLGLAVSTTQAQTQRPKPSLVSRLPPTQQRALLLPTPPPMRASQASALPVTPLQQLPAKVDWRALSGRNYITPVKSQVGGTCVAFANTAAVESLVLRKAMLQCDDIDLSDRMLAECNSGYPSDVTAFLKSTGLPKEDCFPFSSAFGACANACPAWQQSAYKVQSDYYYTFPSFADFKSLLATHGPIVTGMNVLEDFFGYSSGVYAKPTLTISRVAREDCLAAAKRAGYKYAGLQSGGQCFAGNTLGYTKKDDSECNQHCIGDSAQICGGAWRNSIYTTDSGAYQGCYEDRGQRALPVQIYGPQGFHSVLVVGYNDCEQAFVVKNSWGTDWGEGGFFRISYREFQSDPIGFGSLNTEFVGVTGPKCRPNSLCETRSDCASNELCAAGHCVTERPKCSEGSDCPCSCRPGQICHGECIRGRCLCLAD